MKPTDYKLGIFCWFGYRLHMAQRAKLIKDAGFTATCIWWGEEEKANTGSLHDLPGIIRDAGLYIDNIHVPFQDCADLASDAAPVRQKIVNQHIAWLADCAAHHIGIMVMHVCPEQDNPPPPNKHVVNSVKDILKAAEDLDVTLAVENTRRNDYLDLVFSEIDSPHLGLCYDSSHDFLWGERPMSILNKWSRRLVTTHLSDNDNCQDRHWLPNKGGIDWPKLAGALARQSYRGPLMLEVLAEETTQPAELFLAAAYESTRAVAKLTQTTGNPDKHSV